MSNRQQRRAAMKKWRVGAYVDEKVAKKECRYLETLNYGGRFDG